MATRRSFFKKLAAIAAVVALAPEIAFGQKIKINKPCQFWYQESLVSRCYSEGYIKFLKLRSIPWTAEIDAPEGYFAVQ